MTPQERHDDAVCAAHEWRDHERGKPTRGDHITIRWPGGPRDFEMDFAELDASMPPAGPGWFWLFGCVDTKYDDRWGITKHDYRTLYARYVSPGVYEMVPHGGSASRENGAADPDVAVRSGRNR